MNLVPRLPEAAPFSPAQRAWLDGFIAGLLSHAGDPPAAEPTDEELPWHDPTLALDERLELAAGRRPEHRLMAAMAQLDCGQCGYLCESYAAAIASGAEASLGRCAPGGKATSRMLKELLAEIGSPGEAKTAPISMSAATPNGWRVTSTVASPTSSRKKAAWPAPRSISPSSPATSGTSIDRSPFVPGAYCNMRPTTEIWANPICPGATDNHWLEFIAAAGAVPDPVTPYDYASRAPDEAIAALIAQLAAGAIDVIAVTGAPQFRRLFDVARAYGSAERLLAGLRKTGIAAIGPHARARLPVIFGIARDCEADHTAAAVGGYGTRSL